MRSLRYFWQQGVERTAFAESETAVRAGVPVVPFFITMTDSGDLGEDGFPIPIHTVHILPPLYPDLSLSRREAAEKLAEENYAAWCRTYEEVYGTPVRYGD